MFDSVLGDFKGQSDRDKESYDHPESSKHALFHTSFLHCRPKAQTNAPDGELRTNFIGVHVLFFVNIAGRSYYHCDKKYTAVKRATAERFVKPFTLHRRPMRSGCHSYSCTYVLPTE